MHGHHGWGHHCGGGWGLGFGWFFPALLLGRLISDAFDPPQRGWPYPPQPATAPQPRPPEAQPQTGAVLRCQNCDQTVSADYAFCPHCGKRLAPLACRYCGQTLDTKMTYCPHCGGPAGSVRRG